MKPYFYDILQIISLALGTILTLTGIINGLKGKEWKIVAIVLLSGILFLLVGIQLKGCFQCRNPKLTIDNPHNNDKIENHLLIMGHGSCLPPSRKLALLIHQKDKQDQNKIEQGAWFIHSECTILEDNGTWKLAEIKIGSPNTKDHEFEIYAYSLADSVCNKVIAISKDPLYHGSLSKPPEFSGVFAVVTVHQ